MASKPNLEIIEAPKISPDIALESLPWWIHPCYLLCRCPVWTSQSGGKSPSEGWLSLQRFTSLLLLNAPPPNQGFGLKLEIEQVTSWDICISGVGRKRARSRGQGCPRSGAHRTSEWPSLGRSLRRRGTPAQHLGRAHPDPLLLQAHTHIRGGQENTHCLRYACNLEDWSHSESGELIYSLVALPAIS